MAVVSNPIIGRASGSVGGATFSQWKGRNVLKQKPTVVANPRSEQQQSNRARFVFLLALGRTLAVILRLGFREYAGQMSWLNKFMSTNSVNGAVVWNVSAWELAPSNLVISEGSLYPTPLIFNEIDGNDFTFDWSTDLVANQSGTDLIYVVAMKGTETRLPVPVQRSVGTMTITFDSLVNGDEVLVYAFFARADMLIVSNSNVLVETVGP